MGQKSRFWFWSWYVCEETNKRVVKVTSEVLFRLPVNELAGRVTPQGPFRRLRLPRAISRPDLFSMKQERRKRRY